MAKASLTQSSPNLPPPADVTRETELPSTGRRAGLKEGLEDAWSAETLARFEAQATTAGAFDLGHTDGLRAAVKRNTKRSKRGA